MTANQKKLNSRNEKIKQMLSEGKELGEIAARFKISKTRIAQIRDGYTKKINPTENVKAIAPQIDLEKEQQIAYAFGHVESWLQIFANIAGLTQRELAARVGELLLGKSNRKVVRS